MIAYYPTPEEHKGFLYNNVFITIPVSRFKSAMGCVDIRNWFCGLAESFHAFYGDVELESTINQESQILQRRWNLKYEFPTFGWLTYFSNRVVSFFGKEKVPSLSPYAEQSKDGILLAMGDTPEEAATRREEKFRLERILGADSFTVPVVLPKIDESTVDTERLYETDPFYHLPKMPNGELKPEFTYVPSFQVLLKEFARPDSPEPPRGVRGARGLRFNPFNPFNLFNPFNPKNPDSIERRSRDKRPLPARRNAAPSKAHRP